MNDLERIDETLEWQAFKQNVSGYPLPDEKAQIDAYIQLIDQGAISVEMSQDVRRRLRELVALKTKTN